MDIKKEIMEEKLKELTTVEKQKYAAYCLSRYCNFFRISDERTDKLVTHLCEMQSAISLPEWNNKGSNLELTGRGDCLPIDFKNKIPVEKRKEFIELLEAVVEVGIIDLYGEETNLPFVFLMKSVSILNKNHIRLLDI